MCAVDPEVCQEYFSKDILTPLSTMLPQVNIEFILFFIFSADSDVFSAHRFLKLLILFLKTHLLQMLLIKIEEPQFGMLQRTLFILSGV